MIRFTSDGRYELCWSRPGDVRLYRFRPGQEAAIAQRIAEDHCRGKLPEHAALLLLGAVKGIAKRPVRPLGVAEWQGPAQAGDSGFESRPQAAGGLPPSFAARFRRAVARMIDAGLEAVFGSEAECSGR